MKSLFIISITAFVLFTSISHVKAQSLTNEITIAGTVTLKSGNILIVRNGAVDTRVIADQYTRFINRNGLSISYTDIELGDRIQAFGELTDIRMLYADTIRNVSLPAGGFEQIVTGTVSSKLGGTMLVRSGGSDIEVAMTQDTLILDRSGHRVSLSGLDIGDRVQAFGELINGTLDADTVINLSLDYGSLSAPLAGSALPVPTVPVVPHIAPSVGGGVPQSGVTPAVAQPAVQPVQPIIQESQPLQVFGILMGQSGSTLAILIGGEMWAVSVDQSSIGFDKDGARMSFARMRKGDAIQISGTSLSEKTMKGTALRDVSVSFAQIEAATKKAESKQKQKVDAAAAQNRCQWVCTK